MFPRNIATKRFGRLIAIKIVGRRRGECLWLCQCDCGNKHEAICADLRSGATKSCGCLRRETARLLNTKHGMWGTRIRRIWGGMIQRCANPNCDSFKYYGGRGIKVCDRWMVFTNFVADMGICPDGKSIDRYPNPDGNYEPGNCRWATPTQQIRNQRKTKLSIAKAMKLIKLIEQEGVSYRKAAKRLGIKSAGHVYLILKGKMWPEARQRIDKGKYN